MQENTFSTPRTARYSSTQIGPTAPENMWILFHGYGQSAAYFLKKFDEFRPENSLLIAPEGLSKFYLRGVDGRVGASWMTKENYSCLPMVPIYRPESGNLGYLGRGITN